MDHRIPFHYISCDPSNMIVMSLSEIVFFDLDSHQFMRRGIEIIEKLDAFMLVTVSCFYWQFSVLCISGMEKLSF